VHRRGSRLVAVALGSWWENRIRRPGYCSVAASPLDDMLPGDLGLEEVLRERLGDLGVPVVGGLPVGHGRPNLALPLGRVTHLDGSRGQLDLL
jgi:hypothetical protein